MCKHVPAGRRACVCVCVSREGVTGREGCAPNDVKKDEWWGAGALNTKGPLRGNHGHLGAGEEM